MSTKTKIEARGPWILVKPEAADERENEQGLIIPANEEQEQKARGTVVSVGSKVVGVDKGDQVVYGAFAGEVLKLREGGKDVEYKLLHDDDVIAFIR